MLMILKKNSKTKSKILKVFKRKDDTCNKVSPFLFSGVTKRKEIKCTKSITNMYTMDQ